MADEPPQAPRSHLPSRGQVLRALTFTQNTSALVFSVFLGAHLAAPLSAALGGSSWADKTMMISRDYYLPLEPIAVYAPLGIHLFSSITRRIIIILQTHRPPPLTPHIVTGYLLPFFLIPHLASHRIFPSSPAPAISSLSPSELSFEYVGWGIKRWPYWSVVGYGGLVLAACWHAGVGLMKVVSWLRGPRPSRPSTRITGKRKVGLRGLLAVLLGIVGVGMARVVSDTGVVSRAMEARYEAVYASLPWAALLR